MARVNKTKIAISLIEEQISNARRMQGRDIENKNFIDAGVQQIVIDTFSQALGILRACVGDSKEQDKGEVL